MMLQSTPPSESESQAAAVGAACGVAAYLLWGLSVLFYKQLVHVPVWTVLGHRVIWALLLLIGLISLTRRWPAVRAVLRSRRSLAILVCSAALIGTNWAAFVTCIETGQVTQASLGYFITPLAFVGLGAIVLRERLRVLQVVSIVLATAAVSLMVWRTGNIPVYALLLAGSFGLYSLLRKLVNAEAMVMLGFEVALLLPAAIMVLSLMGPTTTKPDVAAPWGPTGTLAWLMASGLMTISPLLLFGTAAKRLRLATLGFLQYLSPSIQFILGVVVYDEPLGLVEVISFGIIWIALAIYSADTLRREMESRAARRVRTLPQQEAWAAALAER